MEGDEMLETNPRRGRRRPALLAAGALAAVGSALLLTAESASAWSLPQRCGGAPAANACLNGYTDDPYVQVNVGIDVWMSAQEAQAILAPPGTAFTAALYGSDGGGSVQYLQSLPLTYEKAGPTADLSAEFDMAVPRSKLNEDTDGWWGCDKDEVFARVWLYDSVHRTTRTFDTAYWSVCF
jgi:hypothetical protein